MSLMEPEVLIAEASSSALRAVQDQGSTPEEWVIVFGEGAMETLARAGALRSITAMTEMHGLPVTFPEQPGMQPGYVGVLLYADRGGASVAVSAAMLAD